MNSIEKKIDGLFKEMEEIRHHAESEGRSLTAEEKERRKAIKQEIESLCEERKQNREDEELRKRLYGETTGPLTISGVDTSAIQGASDARGYSLRAPDMTKDYRSLYGAGDGYNWEDRDSTFFEAVFSGRYHPGLITRSAMTIGTPSDGGFLVPSQTAAQIHSVSLENEIVMPRCFVQPMMTNEIDLPAMDIGSHAVSLYGGFIASYVPELGTITEHNPKTREMKLIAKKLTGLLRFSNELVSDIPGGETQIINICGKGLAWYRDRSFLKGSGAGEPLGILNAPCTIEVAKETGQTNDTIVYSNLTKMMSCMFAGSFQNSVWVAHQSTIPQLLELIIPVGTGGSYIPVMTEVNGHFNMLTRPVIFTEKTEKLGDRGDLILADFSQYVVGLRSGMRFDMSPHVHFTTDELLARLIERHDGQPLWDEALTLEDGSTTVSPFVVLGAR